MKKRLLVGFIAGLFLILISLSSVSAADWKETFDTDVLASGQWVSYELDHPPGGHNVEWKIVQGFLGGHFDADLSGIAYYNGGSTWKDYEVVIPNFMPSNAEFG